MLKRLMTTFIFTATFAVLLAAAYPSAAQVPASFEEGRTAYLARDWRKAITNLRPLAEAGDVRAQVVLGNMYAEGYGVTRDSREAYRLYRRAAVLGNAEASLMVAALHQRGEGAQGSLQLALDWYKRAAQLGNARGAFTYGILMLRGNKPLRPGGFDLKPDYELAYKWLSISKARETKSEKQKTIQTILDSMQRYVTKAAKAEIDAEVAKWEPLKPEDLGDIPPERIEIEGETPAPQKPVAPFADKQDGK